MKLRQTKLSVLFESGLQLVHVTFQLVYVTLESGSIWYMSSLTSSLSWLSKKSLFQPSRLISPRANRRNPPITYHTEHKSETEPEQDIRLIMLSPELIFICVDNLQSCVGIDVSLRHSSQNSQRDSW